MADYCVIKVIRGDTLDLDITISNYTPVSTDTIKLGIKQSYEDETYLIEKSIDPTELHVHFTSEETQILPERCVFDAQITYADDAGVSYTSTFVTGQIIVKKDVIH